MFRTCKDTFRIPVSKESANTSNSDHNTPKKEYYCEFCSVDSEYKVWNLETDLEIHRRQFHKKEILHLLADPKNFMCTVCLHKQSDKTTLIQHIKSHHLLSPPNATRVKREVFICDYCNRLFFNKQLLSVHIEALHLLSDSQKKKATTKCPSCNLEVTIKSIWFHFLAHGIIHTTTCPICVRTFESTHEILEHIETHPGYYNCCICVYQSKKERHFLNHIDIHKKTVDVNTKSVQNILKYFIPQRKSVSWTKKFLNIFKGITLASEVKICILCQTMCVTDEEMLQHIHGDHSPSVVTEVKKYLCLCGEEFFNNILLKHHVFTLKGHHKAFNGTKEELDRLNRETDSPLVIDMETEVMDTDTLNNVQINNKNEEENNDTSNIETSNIDTSNIDTSNIDTSNIDTSNIDTSNIDTSNIDTSNIDTSNIDTSNIEIYEIHEDVESIDDDENSRAHTLETMEGDSDPVDRDRDTVEVDQDDRIISEKERIEDVVGSEEYDKLIIINNTFKESENSEENSEDTENIVYRVLEVPAEVEFRQETEKVIDEHSIRFHQD